MHSVSHVAEYEALGWAAIGGLLELGSTLYRRRNPVCWVCWSIPTCEVGYAKHTLLSDPSIKFHCHMYIVTLAWLTINGQLTKTIILQFTLFWCDFQVPKCTKFKTSRAICPDPAGGAHSAPPEWPNPLAGGPQEPLLRLLSSRASHSAYTHNFY